MNEFCVDRDLFYIFMMFGREIRNLVLCMDLVHKQKTRLGLRSANERGEVCFHSPFNLSVWANPFLSTLIRTVHFNVIQL